MAWRELPDFLTLYVKLRAFLVSYYAVEFRGVALLSCADADPDIAFPDAEADIARIWDLIAEQERHFCNLFGRRLVCLAQRILKNPKDRITVSFRNLWEDRNIKMKVFPEQNAISLTCVQAARPNKLTFYLRQYWRSELSICAPRMSQNVVVPGSGFELDTSFRFVAVQGDRLRLQVNTHFLRDGSPPPNDQWLYLGQLEDREQMKDRKLLQTKKEIDNNDGSFFHIISAEYYGIGDAINQGDEPIPAGVPVISARGQFKFLMLAVNGHLEIWDTGDKEFSDGKLIWELLKGNNNVEPDPKGHMVLRSDGNFVVYMSTEKIFYTSSTGSEEQRYVLLWDTGFLDVKSRPSNLVKYIWTKGT